MDQPWSQRAFSGTDKYHQSSTSSSNWDGDGTHMHNLEEISVPEILNRDYEHNGFLYKRAQEKVTDTITGKICPALKWQLRYVILYQEYVLYYKNERSHRPSGVFSLKGYNRVIRAEEMTSADQQWAFKVIGMRSVDRTWYFGAASEREMRLWMAYFKVTMEKAIHGKARSKSLRILTELKYRETKFLSGREPEGPSVTFEPGIYEDIEEPLENGDYLPATSAPSLPRDIPVAIPPRTESFRRSDMRGCESGHNTLRHAGVGETKESMLTSSMQSLHVEHSRTPLIPGRGPLPVPPLSSEHTCRESITSEGEDYVQPQPADENELRKLRLEFGSQSPVINMARQSPQREALRPPLPSNNNKQRQGPEGNSFRTKPFIEAPLKADVNDMKAALKPVVAQKPKLSPKPTSPTKPEPPEKPKPRSKPQPGFRKQSATAAKEQNQGDLLPVSAQFNSSDKKTAESMLLECNVNGMYLQRLGTESGKVIMVYNKSNNQCKHYKVFGNGINQFSLTTDPVFSNMPELLRYYVSNALPNTNLKLTQPYRG